MVKTYLHTLLQLQEKLSTANIVLGSVSGGEEIIEFFYMGSNVNLSSVRGVTQVIAMQRAVDDKHMDHVENSITRYTHSCTHALNQTTDLIAPLRTLHGGLLHSNLFVLPPLLLADSL